MQQIGFKVNKSETNKPILAVEEIATAIFIK